MNFKYHQIWHRDVVAMVVVYKVGLITVLRMREAPRSRQVASRITSSKIVSKEVRSSLAENAARKPATRKIAGSNLPHTMDYFAG